jgi:hypothetical protein
VSKRRFPLPLERGDDCSSLVPWCASSRLTDRRCKFPHDLGRAGSGLAMQLVGQAGEHLAERVIRAGIRHTPV